MQHAASDKALFRSSQGHILCASAEQVCRRGPPWCLFSWVQGAVGTCRAAGACRGCWAALGSWAGALLGGVLQSAVFSVQASLQDGSTLTPAATQAPSTSAPPIPSWLATAAGPIGGCTAQQGSLCKRVLSGCVLQPHNPALRSPCMQPCHISPIISACSKLAAILCWGRAR